MDFNVEELNVKALNLKNTGKVCLYNYYTECNESEDAVKFLAHSVRVLSQEIIDLKLKLEN